MSNGFDAEGDNKKKKMALVGVSSLFLVAMVVAVTVGVNNSSHKGEGLGDGHGDGAGEISSSTKAIQTICRPTDYKETCEESLMSEGSNTTDPRELVKIGFKVCMDQLNSAIRNSTTLQALAKEPRTNQALQNCRELLEYAIDDITDSFNRIGTFQMAKLDKFVEDLSVWLSGALTYEQTCLDGFENTTGDAGEQMKKFLKSAQEMTSNGLAIVTELKNMLGSLQGSKKGRRLLAGDEVPSWVTDEKRRLMQLPTAAITPNVVVAQDGSGKYKTINEALVEVPKKSNITFVIYVKAGIYKETVLIPKALTHVTMYGDGPTKTVVSGGLNFVDGIQTFKTATFAVVGANFFCRDMGFENTAGSAKHQAVALRVQSDRSIFFNCQMDGYQDTLYAQTHRQFYRDCKVSGTIDFVFGNSAAVFQNCSLVVRKPLANQQCIVTAQGRLENREPTGLVFQNCHFMGDPAYLPFKAVNKAYLGRPWKQFSRTIIMGSEIDDLIQPEGWLPWMGDFGLNTLFYAEFQNKGPGADLTNRVKWKGIKTLTPQQAADFTPKIFIDGDDWILNTGVPYSPGMM
ncbi:probable pectinesterase/pectinesterase inhibitor 21 [Cucurbita pepo subsp. pepo]|uniref:probable pectinesterase/pectinesterase inhibitor 21 n=1 Tax=Cucurbita pepo subsp. pepo TaxID=3664 RepID=UPI000C9D4946|nr:probable pectinesterase/pectinesterase inhibitor 21 [Cucurbita pepo subsp. pepo]